MRFIPFLRPQLQFVSQMDPDKNSQTVFQKKDFLKFLKKLLLFLMHPFMI